MEGPPLGPGGEDITWPDQVAPRGRKASSTRKIKPQTSSPNFHFTLFFGGFWVPPNDPWHIPLVYYDPNLSHAPKLCPIPM